ncbi:hypothetical protein RI129_002204 [Pyrocoelia pectoralis]|uniref:C2H2-type domain-containing protein n=1 Tax=Pyrocoelia pectoralis TaxID=417401 RepID=A0AAN7ZKU9_9COLE
MFFCFICSCSASIISDLFKHLRMRHALFDGAALELKCFKTGCNNTYHTFSGYRKHITKCTALHSDSLPGQSSSNDTPTENIIQHKNANADFRQCLTSNVLRSSLSEYCSSYVSKLYTLGLPDSTIQIIIDSTNDLLQFGFNHYKSTDFIDTNLFADLNTKYKREKFFKSQMVNPIDISLGVRLDQIWNKKKRVYVQTPISCKFVYIPILKTLKFLLNNSSFRNLMHYDMEVSKNTMNKISDGQMYNSNLFFLNNRDAFQLQLYFDEFESVNPLGSKTGGHKIGAIYMTITNIPNHFNSNLQNIHLVALFYSNDIKSYGFNKILDVIVKDIKTLENEGVYNNYLGRKIKGSIVALSHDNLGGNQLFGMVESFSATYYCRICLASKNETLTLTRQNDALLRTNDLYEEHCRTLKTSIETSLYGIKYRSCLNDLKYFKLCNNPTVDIMHDLLEGVVQLEIKLFLRYLISQKIITIVLINRRIAAFNFGINNRSNKPSPLCLDKIGSSIGQRAGQTLCLIKFLPLIISDAIKKIPTEHANKYKVIELLMSIVNIAFSPSITIQLSERLNDLVSDHHRLYQLEYKKNLTPKHHMMTHYKEVITKMGPLVNLWAMRFEAKHAYFKNLVHSLKNFKSICSTLAFRHQEYMWHSWTHINLSFNPRYAKTQSIDIRNTAFANELYQYFGIPVGTNILTTNSVLTFGFKFQNNMFITNAHEHNFPIFSQIQQICIFDGNPFIVCKRWKTKIFHEMYQAYEIIPLEQYNTFDIIDLKCLKHLVPYELHHTVTENINIIVPKYYLGI